MSIISNMMKKEKKSSYLFFAVLLFLSVLMVYYYYPLPGGHDLIFHIKRLEVLTEALRNHQFPVYVDNEIIFGYGYPIKFFYCDLLLIPFAFIGLFTGVVSAYICLIFVFTVLCGLFTYHAINVIYKSPYVAALAALLYTFAPYRLLDIYQRAALGEMMSFTFLPVVMLGLYYIMHKDYKKWYVIAIGFSFTIFTHVISSILIFFTLLVILAFSYKKIIKDPKILMYLALAGLATLIITAYYTYPLIEQYMTNEFYSKNSNAWTKMSNSEFRLGIKSMIKGSINIFPGANDPFMPRIGIMLPVCIVLRLLLIKMKRTSLLKMTDIGILIGLIYLVFIRYIILWKYPPLSYMDLVSFPWRLLEFCTFFFIVGASYYLFLLVKTPNIKYISLSIIALYISGLIITDSINTKNTISPFRIETYKEDLTYKILRLNWAREYIPFDVPSVSYIHQRGDSIKTQDNNTSISGFEKKDGVARFHLETGRNSELELPFFYYKGYKATLNNQEIPVSESNNGLVQISPPGPGKIEVYYEGTTIQKTSWLITLISIAGLCIYILIRRKRGSCEL